MINLFNKTNDFIKMINLLSKTHDFVKNKIYLVKQVLASPGHVRFQTFGPIWHVSGPEIVF